MNRYKTDLSKQVGKRLVQVIETSINCKTLVFDDGTSLTIESQPWHTPSGDLGCLTVHNDIGV